MQGIGAGNVAHTFNLWLRGNLFERRAHNKRIRGLNFKCLSDPGCLPAWMIHQASGFALKYVPLVNLDANSPNGEGFVWCCFVGGATGERVMGMHRLLFGERCEGLCNGSNSKLRFRVAPQAILNRSKLPSSQIRVVQNVLNVLATI